MSTKINIKMLFVMGVVYLKNVRRHMFLPYK